MEERMAHVEKLLVEINTKLDAALADIGDHECRLRALESRGGKRWDALVEKLLMAAAGAFAGWLLGQGGL